MISRGERTFIGAMIAQVTASIALFTGHLDGTQWITVIPFILAIYAGKSVGESYVTAREKK